MTQLSRNRPRAAGGDGGRSREGARAGRVLPAPARGPRAPDRERHPRSLHDHVYHELRRMVMLGGFKPGQKIKIRTLAAALGTSLTPVREALRRLVAEGAFVGEPNRSVRMPPMTVERVKELKEIRVVVEGFAARQAAQRIAAANCVAARATRSWSSRGFAPRSAWTTRASRFRVQCSSVWRTATTRVLRPSRTGTFRRLPAPARFVRRRTTC